MEDELWGEDETGSQELSYRIHIRDENNFDEMEDGAGQVFQ